jgi:hypothetical protein
VRYRRWSWSPPVEQGDSLQGCNQVLLFVIVKKSSGSVVVNRRLRLRDERRTDVASYKRKRIAQKGRLRELVRQSGSVQYRTPGIAVFKVCFSKALP